MRVINISKKITLAENISIANNYLDKARGLIGVNEPQALLFKTRWGIHTFGMKFPIDVIVFNEKNIVCVVKENLKANSVFFWNPRYKNVLELPTGTIKNTLTDIGDCLVF